MKLTKSMILMDLLFEEGVEKSETIIERLQPSQNMATNSVVTTKKITETIQSTSAISSLDSD